MKEMVTMTLTVTRATLTFTIAMTANMKIQNLSAMAINKITPSCYYLYLAWFQSGHWQSDIKAVGDRGR